MEMNAVLQTTNRHSQPEFNANLVSFYHVTANLAASCSVFQVHNLSP